MLGIASIVFGYTVLVPIAAIVVGAVGLRTEPAGRPFSTGGIIVGALSLALPLMVLIVGLVFIVPWGVAALLTGF